MKKIILISSIVFLFKFSFSQEEITVMQYNLLGYTSGTYITCNQTNNNISSKDGYIKTIAQYVKPDIMTVNEISLSSSDHDRLIKNCLNVDGITTYKKAALTNYSGSNDIINQIFYRSDKFTLVSSDALSNSLRDINIYKFKYFKKDATSNYIYLWCIVAHLKAGSYSEDAAERAEMTKSIMTYMSNSLNKGENVLVMGDFNIYSSSETAFQNLVSNSNVNIKFNDFAAWSKLYQTQSTHTSDNGCAATGGLDDRFDLILGTNCIVDGTKKVSYVANSYKALGQDGNNYNSALKTSNNTVVPVDIATALYNNSDHLPVVLKLKIETGISGIEDFSELNGIEVRFQNPTSENLKLFINNTQNYIGKLSVDIYSIIGQNFASKSINLLQGNNQLDFDLNNLKSGVYIIKFTDKDLNVQTKKLVVE
jgi:exonuclease III